MMAGTLRSQISIERYSITTNEYGEPIYSWFSAYTVRANVKQTTGNEKFISAEKISTSTHIIRIRFIEDITTEDRILYKNKLYDIISAINLYEKSRDLIIVVKEVQNE